LVPIDNSQMKPKSPYKNVAYQASKHELRL